MAPASCGPDFRGTTPFPVRLVRYGAALLLALLLTQPAGAQQSREALFSAQRTALDAARAELVDVLAPRAFGQAMASLQAAERDFDRGRDPARVNTQLTASSDALREATRVAQNARSIFSTVLQTRADAVTADAAGNAPEAWARASERLADAAARLERGDGQGAQRRAAEAEVLLREAELLAIKGAVLGEARTLIARADEADVADFAPRTLADAKRLLAQADQEINRNRYDLSVSGDLAGQAAYQASHALFLAQVINQVEERRRNDFAIEELLLGLEQPVARLAGEAGVVPRFDRGVQPVLEEVQAHVQSRQQEVVRLRQEVADHEMQLAALNAEVVRLEERLGGVSQERIALQRRVDAQARLRASLATIESTFLPDEARVIRQGDDVVVSLLGINFPVGRSTIDASNGPLLNKVRDSLALFPGASLVVEGHTDSQGSDSTNLILSQDRADAVKQYIVTNFGVDPEKVTSIGYGETRPAASNDTPDGRARNRRIDLVIRMDAGQMGQ